MSWFENLKKIKAESGMSIHEIAIKSGLPEPTLEKIFSGATKSPGIYTVQTVVHALGYTLNDIDPGTKKSPGGAEGGDGDELRSILVHNFDQLNQEGQEILVEQSDTMVSSGKYIKTDKNQLGKTQRA